MKRLASLFSLLILAGCQPQNEAVVRHAGALRNMMFNGDISAKIDLDSLKGRPHLFALGALENLRGEILIWDSQPIISLASDSVPVLDHSFGHKATLLVYAEVPAWQTEQLASVNGEEELISFFEKGTFQHNQGSSNAIPFLIEASAHSLSWHVIHWPEGKSDHSHQAHQLYANKGQINGEKVKLFGVYSTQHTGVFVHHSTSVHLHVVNQAGTVAGHVDQLGKLENVRLSLPKES